MRCPYCDHGLVSDAAECPSCRLNFQRATALLGATPRFMPGVSDMAGLLLPPEVMKLKRRIAELEQGWPQLVVQLVVHQFPTNHPFSLYVFWFFNSSAFAGASRRGVENHVFMVALDPSRGEGAIMPGYGLEPLLPPEMLDYLLARAGDWWEHGEWAQGFHAVLDGLEPLLESVSAVEDSGVVPGEF